MQDQIVSAETKASVRGREGGVNRTPRKIQTFKWSTAQVSDIQMDNAPASDNLRARVGRRGDLVAGGRAQTGERLRDVDATRNSGGAIDQ